MRKKWLVLLCLFVIIGAAALSIWWSARQTETAPSFLLPDSNRVHLVAVTVGTNVKMNFGTPIERVLARLPGKLGKRFKRNEISVFSHRPYGAEIVLWFRYDRPVLGTYLRSRVLEDGELLHTPTYSAHPQTLSNGQTVAHCGTHLWPRRARMLTFRVEQAFQSSHESVYLGDVTVANPAHASHPIWVPEELPATREFNTTTFTLEHPARRHQTRVQVMSDGEPDTSWEVWNHWLRDATGNFVTKRDGPRRLLRETANDRGIITLSTMPYGMPKEPAWRIGFQFVRTGGVASNQVFVWRGVPVSSTGSRFHATWKTNLPVGIVQLTHQPDWEDDSRRPCLMAYQPESVDLANPARNPLAIMILSAVNDAGQKIPTVGGQKIHVPAGSKTLDITIAIPPQHCVEYTVDPKALVPEPSAQPISTPAYMKIPDSIHPEKIHRELEK